MRGKIGYKRPLIFTAPPGLRVTYFEQELLDYTAPSAEFRATYFEQELLDYIAPSAEFRATYFEFEVLTHIPPT